MLTNITNQQQISHLSTSNKRFLSAHHPELSSFSDSKKVATPHMHHIKNLSSSKQNTLAKPLTNSKQNHFSEWNRMTESRVNKKQSVVVIEMESLEKCIEDSDNISQPKDLESVLTNPQKILLPVKEYSNKFLRQKKAKSELEANHTVLRPKKSFIYIRKQVRKNRQNQRTASKHKQNSIRSLKTQYSQFESVIIPRSKQLHQYQNNSVALALAPMANCQNIQNYQHYQSQSLHSQSINTTDKNNRVSTSRALEMFSKVYKNEGIERMRIRKQVGMNKTTQVQVKQMVLQDIPKKQLKRSRVVSSESEYSINRSKPTSKSKLPKKQIKREHNSTIKADPTFYIDDDNFQLAGW